MNPNPPSWLREPSAGHAWHFIPGQDPACLVAWIERPVKNTTTAQPAAVTAETELSELRIKLLREDLDSALERERKLVEALKHSDAIIAAYYWGTNLDEKIIAGKKALTAVYIPIAALSTQPTYEGTKT